MSVESIVWALDCQDVSGADKLVLIGIANHADKHGGNAWPSVDTLTRYACVSRRSVQRSIGVLVELGLLVVHPNEGGDRRTRSDRRPNLYELTGATHVSPGNDERGDAGDATGRRGRPNGVTPTSPEPSSNQQEPSKDPSDADASGVEVLTTNQVVNRVQRAYWVWVKGQTGRFPVSLSVPAFNAVIKPFVEAGVDIAALKHALASMYSGGRPFTKQVIEQTLDGRGVRKRADGRYDGVAAVDELTFDDDGRVVG